MSEKIVVIGGGIMGCTTALLLSEQGHQVTVVERNIIASQTSGESSWAGAGIIFPLLPWMYRDEVNQLALAGVNLYPAFCQRLLKETGIDPECINSGMLIKSPVDQNIALAWCHKYGVAIEQDNDGLLLTGVSQVKPPKLLQSLKLSLIQRGVTLAEETQLKPISERDEITTWQSEAGEVFEADKFVVTSGAWSFELLKKTASTLNIKPMRGQILLYQLPPNTLPHIVYQDGFYLLQRRDGYLLAGSTLEDVGFDAGISEAVKQQMQSKAESILPILKDAPIIKHWSGLRPGTPENLPIIAVHPTIKNLYLNTGHFRYGLTMAPESARRLVALMS